MTTTNRETTPPTPAWQWLQSHVGHGEDPAEIEYNCDDMTAAFNAGLATPSPAAQEPAPYTCCQCNAATWNDDDWCDQCRQESAAQDDPVPPEWMGQGTDEDFFKLPPKPAAQDDPAKGLEFRAEIADLVMDALMSVSSRFERPTDACEKAADAILALTDHATAERQIAELRSRVAELEGERRNIVSHATMGSTDGEGLSVNQISVEITRLRNDHAKRALAAEARVAQLERHLALAKGGNDAWFTWGNKQEARALAAEAENKGLREALSNLVGAINEGQDIDPLNSEYFEDARQALAAKEAGHDVA